MTHPCLNALIQAANTPRLTREDYVQRLQENLPDGVAVRLDPNDPGQGDMVNLLVDLPAPVFELTVDIPKRPKIIAMCGSSRFIDIMAVCGWLLEKEEGAIVMGLHLLPFWYTRTEHHLAESEGVAKQMDALHLKKIDMADEIFVVNFGHYIGESTAHEVDHAIYNRKIPVRWFTHDPIGKMVQDQILKASDETGATPANTPPRLAPGATAISPSLWRP